MTVDFLWLLFEWLVLVLHLAASVVALLCVTYIFYTVFDYASRIFRLGLMLIPIGAAVNIWGTVLLGFRSVSAGECFVMIGLALALLHITRRNLNGLKCKPCIYDIVSEKTRCGLPKTVAISRSPTKVAG